MKSVRLVAATSARTVQALLRSYAQCAGVRTPLGGQRRAAQMHAPPGERMLSVATAGHVCGERH